MTAESAKAPAPVINLTPTQIRGLKLAKEGDLHPDGEGRWTHLNAVITYARTDRFKERPRKIRFVTAKTMEELRSLDLLQSLNEGVSVAEAPHGITMPGKMWLLRNK